MTFKTEQENFWAGEFGNEYIARNDSKYLIAGNLAFFSQVLDRTSGIKTIIEFGSNIGNNLKALHLLLPDAELSAIEINKNAAMQLSGGGVKVYNQSILEFTPDYQRDLVFIKGVLIHINPDELNTVYKKLYDTSNKYILVAEYYNPTPVVVNYRGHDNRLFKRDFAGEMLDNYKDLQLIDYGFAYHRDNNHPQDDLTWFLIEKCIMR